MIAYKLGKINISQKNLIDYGIYNCIQKEEKTMIKADTVFTNGTILTLDSNDTICQSVAVKHGRIISTGTNEDLGRFIGEGTKVIDLEGKMMLPAAYDAHVHCTSMGASDLMVDFSFPEIDSIEKMRTKLKEAVKGLPKGAWVRGFGLNDLTIAEYAPGTGRIIHHKDFDDCCPDNPVKITLWTGHSVFVNELALELAGIKDDTPNPIPGHIVRDQEGHATGLLHEGGCVDLIDRIVPKFTEDEIEQAIMNFQKMINSNGYTGYTNATLGPCDNRNSGISDSRPFEVYRRLAKEGKLTARVSLGLYAGQNGIQTAENVAESIDAFPFERYNETPDLLKVDLIKLFCDGTPMVHTAWTFKDYLDAPGNHGHSCFLGPDASDEEQLDELKRIVKVCHNKGHQVAIHAIGDRAVSACIDSIAEAIEENPRSDSRHYVIHADSMGTAEHAMKAAQYGILFSVQPGLFDYIVEPGLSVTGEDVKRAQGLRDFLTHGVKCCGGSDGIIGHYQNWLSAVQSAVKRRSHISGIRYRTDLCLTITEAIRLYTIDAVYQEHLENELGSVEIGKCADFQVLDRDIYRTPIDEIGSIQVLQTYKDGVCVFDRNAN